MKHTHLTTALPVILFCLGLGLGQENYAQWSHYRVITLNTTASQGGANIPSPQTRFPVLVRLNPGNFDFTQAAANGSDLRFTKADGVTRLPHQVERWDTAARAAEIWVLLDTVSGNGSNSFRLYSGKIGAADSSSGAAVFATTNGFQGVFHLNEAANDTIRDATSNHLKGVPRNVGGVNPTDAPGAIGNAKNFLGNNANNNGGSYRLVTSTGGNTYRGPLDFQNDSVTANGVPAYTLSAWIYMDAVPTGPGNRKAILAKSDGINGQQYHLRLLDAARNQTSSGPDTNRLDFADGPTAVYKTTATGLTTGAWFHVTAVRNGRVGVTTSLAVYVNGGNSLMSSNSLTLTTPSDYNVYIGSFSNDSGFFSGKIDEVEFSNVARDSNWIRLSYETQKPGASCVTTGAAVAQAPAPSNLTYSANPATYSTGLAITPNVPTVTSVVTSYSISPPLPAGLTLNPVTGVIAGTPTTAAATDYTVTASNAAGSTQVLLSIIFAPVQREALSIITRLNNAGGNPFSFRIPEGSTATEARVSVKDVWGRSVWEQTFQVGGGTTISWDGISSNGRSLAEGVYVVRIQLLDAGRNSLGITTRAAPLSR